MKHLKQYENINHNPYQDETPKVGDYVIMNSSAYHPIKNFIENNIGQITEIAKDPYSSGILIHYSNIPENIQKYFLNNTRPTSKTLIKHWSSNKEDLEIFIAQNKYNL